MNLKIIGLLLLSLFSSSCIEKEIPKIYIELSNYKGISRPVTEYEIENNTFPILGYENIPYRDELRKKMNVLYKFQTNLPDQ